MLSISHGLSGALLATKLTHPLLFIPACLAIHYLEDWIPHWDVGTGLSTGKRQKTTAILLEIVELAVTVGLVYWLWGTGNQETLWLAGTGAFCALLPDFIEAPKNFLNFEPKFLKTLNDFHGHFHASTPDMVLGLAPQVVTILAVFFLK